MGTAVVPPPGFKLDSATVLLPPGFTVDVPRGTVTPSGATSSGLGNFIDATGLPAIYHAAIHPLDTAVAIPDAIKSAYADSKAKLTEANDFRKQGSYGGAAIDALEATPGIGGFLEKQMDNYVPDDTSGNLSRLGGTLGGTLAGLWGPEALGAAAKGVAPTLNRIGEGAINNAIDATPKMMKYGQNPARGLVDAGVINAIPRSMTKFGLQSRLEPALESAGQAVGNAVQGGGFTPSSDIASSIESPILSSANIMTGPGGARSVSPLADLWSSMEETAPGSSKPIYGPQAGTDVGANDLWKTIQNIDKNTRFNPDPEVEGLNEVRRSMRSGLRGNLEDAVPGLKPLSQTYGDLRVADDALSRTANKGTSLKSLTDAIAFPAETSGGAALIKTAKGLQAVTGNPFFSPVQGATSLAPLFFAPKKAQ